MTHETNPDIQYELAVLRELQAAERESESTTERYPHAEVMAEIRQYLNAMMSV